MLSLHQLSKSLPGAVPAFSLQAHVVLEQLSQLVFPTRERAHRRFDASVAPGPLGQTQSRGISSLPTGCIVQRERAHD